MSDAERQRNVDFIIYHGQGSIPKDATSIRVHPSVRVIPEWAFDQCSALTNAELPERLEELGEGAFRQCTSLRAIIIPKFVKVIPSRAFYECSALTSVKLSEGLEEIGEGAFCGCTSLNAIIIPPIVKVIPEGAFYGCWALTSVELSDGLEEIGEWAFAECRSLREIVIPPAVRDIHDTAFDCCTNLTRVKFCNEIEEFVSCNAMMGWWNRGVGEISLRTYCFLVQCNILTRFAGLAPVSDWQATIHDMLSIIPIFAAIDHEDDEDEDSNNSDAEDEDINEDVRWHFDAIDAQLTVYENLLNEAHVLFPRQYGLDNGIVLVILSFV
mgnify:CR=1 FL=1